MGTHELKSCLDGPCSPQSRTGESPPPLQPALTPGSQHQIEVYWGGRGDKQAQERSGLNMAARAVYSGNIRKTYNYNTQSHSHTIKRLGHTDRRTNIDHQLDIYITLLMQATHVAILAQPHIITHTINRYVD